jgi:hypothetical protein
MQTDNHGYYVIFYANIKINALPNSSDGNASEFKCSQNIFQDYFTFLWQREFAAVLKLDAKPNHGPNNYKDTKH